MKPPAKYLRGSVLPTVVVVSVVILTALLGLLSLWEQESLLAARAARLQQARADVESAYALYALHPDDPALTELDGYLLYDSLPQSRVFLRAEPWGLYEAVHCTTIDSLVAACRIFGVRPEAAQTLYYTDNRAALTLAGRTELRGRLRLPQNGVAYGRVGSDYFSGTPVAQSAVGRSDTLLPQIRPQARRRAAEAFAAAEPAFSVRQGDSLRQSFRRDTTLLLAAEKELYACTLRGRIRLTAEELRIDSTCRMEHPLVVARKIIVGAGARITAQLFARDTVVVERGAALEYPSGIYTGRYAEISEGAEVNGYVVVCDTSRHDRMEASYRQAPTARVRGLVYVDGVAQVQGIVAGRAVLRRTAFFSPQGYYKDTFYDATLLENPVTAHPFLIESDTVRRKEAACVD